MPEDRLQGWCTRKDDTKLAFGFTGNDGIESVPCLIRIWAFSLNEKDSPDYADYDDSV